VRPVGSKYLLEEPLGRGATGTVWRALVRGGDADGAGTGPGAGQPGAVQGGQWDTVVPAAVPAPGERVAIKVLREELANDPDVVMRFLRERSALLRLRHENIVRVRDLVVEGELLALVMDLVQGPDLHRYLREHGRIGPAAGALLMAEVADALAASHADGVVHRDLKPANVLLVTAPQAGGPEPGGSLGRPMLTDFGIARLADSAGVTRTHEFVGTPAYVAPETAEGRPQTSAVDVYGAGIMLYELVTGKPPFEGEGPLQILQAHLKQEPRRPGMLPEPLWAVIERCLRKNPAERPSAVALGAALRTVAAGIGVHASPEAIYAAERVAEQLTPDPSPAAVPGTGAGPNDPTVPRGVPYDPAASTMGAGPVGGRHTGAAGAVGAAGAAGAAAGAAAAAAARTEVLRQDAAATEVMGQGRAPGMPPAAQSGGPGGPGAPGAGSAQHPWQTQLRAARTRNEQTQVGYPPPAPAETGRPQVAPDPYQNRPARAPQPYAPQPYQQPYQPQREPQREPQRGRERERERDWERDRERERRPRREPRPRRRMRIPGGGCLRSLLVLIVIAVLIWNFTPLHQWVDNVVHWWNGLVGTVDHVRNQVPKVKLPHGGSGG
jgi:serine/threonine-protein kinase